MSSQYMDAFPDFKEQVVSLIEGKDGTVVCETLNSSTQAKDMDNDTIYTQLRHTETY